MDKEPIVVRSCLVPRRFCVNIFGMLWVRDHKMLTPALINHERIHTAQMRELLFIPFYILYLIEWLWRLAHLRNWYAAYTALSFEREAYSHGNNLHYLPSRRHFAQWRQNKNESTLTN